MCVSPRVLKLKKKIIQIFLLGTVFKVTEMKIMEALKGKYGTFYAIYLKCFIKVCLSSYEFSGMSAFNNKAKEWTNSVKNPNKCQNLKKKKTFSNHRATKPPQKKPALPNDD